jgi:hypothetical protein
MQKNSYKAVLNGLRTVFLIVFFISCAPAHNLTGKWQVPGTTSSIELRQDGTFTVVDNMGMVVSGIYTLHGKEKIQFEIKSPDSAVEIITGIHTVQGEELVLTSAEGEEVLRYKKVR